MASIADIFLKAVLDDSTLQVDAARAGDKAGATLGSRMSGGMKKAASGLFTGLGIGAGISAFGAIDTAISKTIGFLGDAVAAAREDEESQARLGAALKANIPNWNGQTGAIEDTILARQKLGFADEEQRKSLALLSAATHDVNKALAINRTAMDLARIKGISLEEASSALVKVEGGQYRALKALGIVLPQNATAEEALAAVQKVATGQAEAYAQTNEGKLLVSQIKVSEAMEKLGYIVMPLVTDALVAVADAAEPVVKGILDVVEAVKQADAWVKEHTASLTDESEQTDLLGDKTTWLGKALHGLADDLSGVTIRTRIVEEAMSHARGGVDSDGRGMAASIGSVGKAAVVSAGQVVRSVDKLVSSWADARSEIEAAATGFANAMWDPLIAKAKLATTEREIAEQQAIIASKNSTRVQIQDADQRLAELQKDKIGLLAELVSYGDKASAAELKSSIAILKATKNLTAEQVAQLNRLEAELAQVERAAKLAAAAIERATPEAGHHYPGSGRAGGGPVYPGQTYTIGEKGPETLHMGASGGFIEPNAGWSPPPTGSSSGGSSAPAGSGHTFNIQLAGGKSTDPYEVPRQLRRLADWGTFDPEHLDPH